MSALRDLQYRFMQFVANRQPVTLQDAVLADAVLADGLTAEQRLTIYRNNVFTNFTDALTASYPVIHRLVGEAFFRQIAYQYIQQHPSTSGDLYQFGDQMADFLRQLPTAQQLPYLADVAELEWAYEQVFYAAETASLDLTALAQVPADCHESLRFHLNPASRLLTSPYPTLAIWRVNQADYQGNETVDLASGGNQLLLLRNPQGDVVIYPLTPGEYALLSAFNQQKTFAEACAYALSAESESDIPSCFRHHVLLGTLVSFSL